MRIFTEQFQNNLKFINHRIASVVDFFTSKKPFFPMLGRRVDLYFVLELLVVLLVNRSVDDLNDLNDGNDKNCKTECDTVFHEVEVSKLKCICKEGNLDNNGSENEGESCCAPEPPVLLLHGEDRAVEASHVECVADLTERKGEERHGCTESLC